MASRAESLAFEGAATLISFLEGLGAREVKHSGGTFLDHLVGTAAILEHWGGSPRVCGAGLFHSIYGTEFFRQSIATTSDRARVRAALGPDAERLAHIFCVLDRRSVYRAIEHGEPYAVKQLNSDTPIPVSPDELRDLVWIGWANELEQAHRVPVSTEHRARARRALRMAVPFLPDLALRDLEALFGPLGGASGENVKKPGLATLLNLEDTRPFFAEHWPEKMFVARGPVERLSGLVDYDFDSLVKMKKAFTKAYSYSMEGKPISVTVQPGQERALYDAGFTIYFHALRAQRMAEWVDELDSELGLVRGYTRVAAFASRRGKGLIPHYDQNDNFVCQARGVKRWRIAPNTHVRHPTLGYTLGAKPGVVHEIEAPDGFPAALPEDHQTIEMQPGTVLFMPRGMWHDTETVESESLHFNIQSGLAMWKDAIEFVLTQTSALYAEELREPIVGLFKGERTREGFEEEFKERVRAVLEMILESDIHITRATFNKYIMSRRPKS